jgi:hypothetical protein
LSRACLGKMMHFTYKWLKKTVFSPGVRRGSVPYRCKKTKRSFLSAFPTFVPSLSWQNGAFFI